MVINNYCKGSLRRMFKPAALLLAFLLALPAQAAVQLVLDRDRVMVGETVTLTFLTDDATQDLGVDFSALEQDFDILDQRTESQISIVNGRQAATKRLLLTVEPKRAGQLTIPAFRFGDDTTRAVVLEVAPAPELAPGELPPVFIEAEITPSEGPYFVHAQFGLVVRVFYRQNLTEATISQPSPAPAAVSLLQETPYQAERGGERYRVLERHYAVFPERSGELLIPPMELSGRLVERKEGSVWQPTVRGRRVREQSPEIRLQIEPRPAEFTGTEWQPAREYRIAQQISSGEALRVGEPVTRTILIDAKGLAENMIAEPEWPVITGARVYADQPQGITRDDGRWVLGHKEFRYAVVPEAEGKLVLPELRVEWWDTESNRQRSAVLPAHTVTVQPSALVPPPEPAGPQTGPQAPGDGVLAESHASYPWKWLALLFAGLWLATLGLAFRLGRNRARASTRRAAADAAEQQEQDLLRSFRTACRQGDNTAARACLQRWLLSYGPPACSGLHDFAAQVDDDELRSDLLALDADGFRPGGQGGWDGSRFWRRFSAWRQQRAHRAAAPAPASDLYARENRVRPAD
ncbi:MAG: BatD family protein [Lysobacterales bacterium]|jgi:hypothetical protein